MIKSSREGLKNPDAVHRPQTQDTQIQTLDEAPLPKFKFSTHQMAQGKSLDLTELLFLLQLIGTKAQVFHPNGNKAIGLL